jgi:hypothetical protein
LADAAQFIRKTGERGTFAVPKRNSRKAQLGPRRDVVTLINFFDVLMILTPIICLLVTFGMRWTPSPEDRGCVLLKQKAAALGVDVNRIPDPAWHAIVDMSIASAKDRAMCSRGSLHRVPGHWEVNLDGTLEEEAVEISKFMKGSACSGRSVAPHILMEYRV